MTVAHKFFTLLAALSLVMAGGRPAAAAPPRLVVVDQDTSGPGGSDIQAVALLLQAPDVDVLGIVVPSGNAWRDEEVQHALRLTEVMRRTDVPVVPGAVFPLVHTKAENALWMRAYGAPNWYGAWMDHPPGNAGNANLKFIYHDPGVVPPLPEGAPAARPSAELGAAFLDRQVRAHPGQVTVIALGPMTDLALAVRLDPDFPRLAKELVFMGGSIAPALDTYFSLEFVNDPRHEFNLWWDPEASRIVLRAPWRKITCTPVDVSLKTELTPAVIARVSQVPNGFTAGYLQKYALPNFPMWDELAVAAWLDPSLITRETPYYLDCDCDHGASYGDTQHWAPGTQPGLGEQPVGVSMDLDNAKFVDDYVALMQRPLPAVQKKRPL